MSEYTWLINNKFKWEIGKKFVRRDGQILTVDFLRRDEGGEINAVFFEETSDVVYIYGFVAHNEYGPPELDQDIISEYVEPKKEGTKLKWIVGMWYQDRAGDKYKLLDIRVKKIENISLLFKNINSGEYTSRECWIDGPGWAFDDIQKHIHIYDKDIIAYANMSVPITHGN